jgi:HPt (histidine-containing phosphotransfer) domain-containing protein
VTLTPQATLFRPDVALTLMGGDPGLLREVAGVTRSCLPDQLRSLTAAVGAGTLEEALRHAHTLKGTAAGLGVESLRAAAHAIETACRASDFASVAARLPDVESLAGRLCVELDDFLAS